VLHHDGDTVRFGIQFAEKFFFADLGQRAIRQPLVAVQLAANFFEVMG